MPASSKPPLLCFIAKRYLISVLIFAFCLRLDYSMPGRMWTANFRFFDAKLSSKSNFPTYSQCERIIYQSTPTITPFQNNVSFVGKTVREPSLSVTNEQIHSLTYRHSALSVQITPAKEFDVSAFVFVGPHDRIERIEWRIERLRDRKNRTSRYISFFPPIIQLCSISDVLFTGGRRERERERERERKRERIYLPR